MTGQTAQMLGTLGPLVIMIILFYFFIIRPQKKKEAQVREMRESLKVGDEVITIGGIIGKIVIIKEDYIVLESSGDKSRIDVMKWSINSTIKNKEDLKA